MKSKLNNQLLKTISNFFLLLILVISFTGCSKKFDEINTDPTRLTSLDPNDVKGLFSNAEYAGLYGGWNYQTSQGLFADQYCQYFAGTQTAFASHRYVIVQKWVKDQFVSTYVSTMPSLFAIIKNTNATSTPTLNAIARIWKAFVLHRTTDYYGPIPYSQIGSDSTVVAYDNQKDIYNDFFKELTEASTLLKNNLSKESYGDKDKIYNGDNAKWLKFCNSLRLRLALRISNVDPVKAKAEAEAAVAAGVLTDAADDANYKVTPDNFNPFGVQSGWNEFRMSATMESVLKGYSDPRLSIYFQPAVASGQYHGVRNGLVPAEQNIVQNDYDHNSNVAPFLTPDDKGQTNFLVMHAAESYFLRAEGALNGWNMGGGTAQSLYEKGIEVSMNSWGITNTAAINNYINGVGTPIALNDYFSTPALTDIPVKWTSVTEKQREQIQTQKWLALFPDGHEAWAEMRRSKYPKFYPLIHSDNADVPSNTMIRRITFLDYDRDRNKAAVDAAVGQLGGPDKASTKLWWDK
jgi:hypothetical protein